MGSITFQVVGDASVGTKTKTYTVSDADVNRLVEFAKSLTGIANPTVTQALLAWANNEMDAVKRNVKAFECNQATASIAVISAS
jgi:hypothetical protein